MQWRWLVLVVAAAAAWVSPRVAVAACPIRAPAMVPEPSCPPAEQPSGPVDTRFLRHPYEKGNAAFTVQVQRNDRYRAGRDFYGRIGAVGGWIPKSHIRGGGSARIGATFLDLDSSLQGVTGVRDRDALYVGSTNLSFPFIRERVTVRIGGGVRYSVLGRPPSGAIVERAAGWNLTSSVDAFPFRPIVLSSQVDMGRLARQWAFQWRGSVGVVVRGVEVLAALDYFVQGKTKIGGPLLGLRLWI